MIHEREEILATAKILFLSHALTWPSADEAGAVEGLEGVAEGAE